MTRVFYPYREWEDYRAGMWKPSERVLEHVALSAELLADPDSLGHAMRDVVSKWPKATAQNLTNVESNRRSWLGQAACCFIHGTPEVETRRAWWTLTDQQRDAANAVADAVILEWEAGVGYAETLFG